MNRLLTIFLILSSFLYSKELTTKEVQKNMDSKNWILVDTRSSDSFNGWALEGDKRGGHIKGATDFSKNWLLPKFLTEKNITALNKRIEEKGISKDTNVILYDTNNKDHIAVEKYLKNLGIDNVHYYNANEWINNSSLPMTRFKNYELLVPPVWAQDVIEGKNPIGYNGNGYKVFEVSWGPINQALSYIRAHLKGAVHINTDEIEHAPLWSMNNDEDLITFAKNNGINVDETIILYGEDVMASYRVASILNYIGVKDVRVINGGTAAIERDNIPMERGVVEKSPSKNIGTEKIINKEVIVGIDGAKKAIANPNEQLVDIRSWKEYIGEESGYSYMDRKGRPDGSIWGNSGLTSTTLESYRNIDNTMRNGNEIITLWNNLGINPENRMVFFCGSGWRAGEVYVYSKVLGLDDTSVYSNGWMEWSFYKENHIIVESKKSK